LKENKEIEKKSKDELRKTREYKLKAEDDSIPKGRTRRSNSLEKKPKMPDHKKGEESEDKEENMEIKKDESEEKSQKKQKRLEQQQLAS